MTVVNREQQFIYLKTHKTASTSTEIFLIAHAGLGDIYVTSRDIEPYGFNKARHRLLTCPEGAPQPPGPRRRAAWEFLSRQAGKKGTSLARKLTGIRELRQHQSARNVRRVVGRPFFANALKVSSVRNPWDALASAYRWQVSGRGGRSEHRSASFAEFLSDWLEPRNKLGGISRAQYYLYTPYLFDGDALVVDHALFFEALDDSMRGFLERIGVNSVTPDFSRITAKATGRPPDYRALYTDVLAERVNGHFATFLSHFPYSFDRPGAPPQGVTRAFAAG